MMPALLTCQICGATNQPQAIYCRSCGSSLPSTKPNLYDSVTGQLLANVTLKQRYRIIVPIGKGGMAAVYKAEDTQLGNRQVAIKEMSQSGLSPQEQKDAADAFRREALLLARLQHPNLPNIFDHFEENGRWYLVMSLIEGETLTNYFNHAQGRRLPLDEVLQIGMQLCTVLGYLHNQQPAIIFRDLKPANIMRTPGGHIYLIDFGIARHFKPGQSKDTAYFGSMGYAPPEQYGQAQTTPRSDIYSLGATLYQLVSGHDPSTSPFRFPALQSLVPTVPADLAALLSRMLEIDEDKRPASMLLIKQELQAIASASVPNSLMPVTIPASIVPTQPAKPKPGPFIAGPKQLANSLAPTTSVSVQSAIKPASVWAFGKRQLVAMLILAGCYGLITYVIGFTLPFHDRFTFDIFSFGVLLLLPIFFASFFGPWVGLGATGIGFFLADFIRGQAGYDRYGWWFGVLLMIVAFLAGLLQLKTRGQYDQFGNIVLVVLLGLVYAWFAVLINVVIRALLDQSVNVVDSYFSSVFPTDIWAISLPILILLPIFLFISNMLKLAWYGRSTQKYP